ncbi:MAG: alpha/beta hydrolase [Spirochaetes bacterium]|nr:alpha/beta hydrolase [Spirochaetota bacterium]
MNLQVEGCDIYYKEIGKGTPVIMLHGWTVDHRILEGCLESAFADCDNDFRRIYADFPGMGQSKANPLIKNSDDYLRVMKAFIDEVTDGKDYAVIGKSFGGYIARGLAKLDRQRILGMVLICPVADSENDQNNMPARCVMEKESGLEKIIPPEDFEGFDLFHTVQTQSTWENYRDYILPGVKCADYAFLESISKNDNVFFKEVDKVESVYEFPALMIAGKQDWCVGYSGLWEIQKNYVRSTYLALDKAGHNLEHEYPELFRIHIGKWLNDVRKFRG